MTINDVLKCPQEFMYLFATDAYLSRLDNRTASIVRSKRTNQSWLLNKTCIENGAQYANVVSQINQGLIDAFGYSGAQCMQRLAEGKEVAGKDWSKGIYGIGAPVYEGFAGTDITVNASDGRLMKNGQPIANQTSISHKNYTTYTAVVDGVTYSSVYNSAQKKYGAGSYTNAAGQMFSATGQASGLSMLSSIWSGTSMFAPFLQKILDWLLSLFSSAFEGRTVPTETNTCPAQSDGFRYDSRTDDIDWMTVGIGAAVFAIVYKLFKKDGRRGKRR